MKNLFNILLVCFGYLSLAVDCVPKGGHDIITIIINSENKVACQVRIQGVIRPNDTLYDCEMVRQTTASIPNNIVKLRAGQRSGSWEQELKGPRYIQIFIINDSIFRNVPCDTISKYHMVLHRYQLSLEDLQRMDFTVVYPPGSEIPSDSVR